MSAAEISSWIEQISYVVILLLCIYGVAKSYKQYKTRVGGDLLLLGFLMYGAYALLAISLSGIGGSYFHDLTMVGMLNSKNVMYFLSLIFRLGLVFMIIGLFRMGRRTTD
jgi:hypothetical protein